MDSACTPSIMNTNFVALNDKEVVKKDFVLFKECGCKLEVVGQFRSIVWFNPGFWKMSPKPPLPLVRIRVKVGVRFV